MDDNIDNSEYNFYIEYHKIPELSIRNCLKF